MIPDDTDAERESRLVAMMCWFPRVTPWIADIVEPEHFSDDRLRALFVALKESYGEIGDYDVVDVARRAKSANWSTKEIVELGQRSDLSEAMAEHRAREVVQAANRRNAQSIASDLVSQLSATSEDPTLLCQRYASRLAAIDVIDSRGAVTAAQASCEMLERIDRQMAGEIQSSGIKTGLWSLDRMTGGLQAGHLIIIAARPGVGKSALALNFAEIAAVMRGNPALFVSLEMSARELTERLVSGLTGVRATRLKKAILSPEERQVIGKATSEIVSKAPLLIDDRPNATVTKIAAIAQRQSMRPEGLSMIVIDYLQLLTPANRREPRQEQVAAMSRELKQLASRLGVPVICLAQLNRDSDNRTDHRPKKSDLRESGAIEQDADIVLLLHRESELVPASEKEGIDRVTTLIVDKNRHGATGDIFLRWHPETMQFGEVPV